MYPQTDVTSNMKISTPYKDIRVDSTIIPCQFRLDRSVSFTIRDDRRRSIITGRLAGHLFQGELCSKRGTSLTFEIIFKVERSARDLHTLASIARIHVHTHTGAAYIMSPSRSRAYPITFREDDFPLGVREE